MKKVHMETFQKIIRFVVKISYKFNEKYRVRYSNKYCICLHKNKKFSVPKSAIIIEEIIPTQN